MRRVKRLLLLGVLLGAANALAAVATLYGLYDFTPDVEGIRYFGSAPSGTAGGAYGSTLDIYYDGFPWEYVAVPAVLIVLNALLLPLAVWRGWLHR